MLKTIDVWKGVKIRQRMRWILAGANVTLPRGGRIALMGRDALDNTTALHILCGLLHADRGGVRRSGLICPPFDSISMIDVMSTFQQNAVFLSRIYDVEPSDITAIALAVSQVTLRKGKALRAYPAHDRRKIALGFMLAIQFDWYFVNETLPKLTGEEAAAVDRVIGQRISRGGVVWATTNPEKLSGYCNAGLVLDQGDLTFYDNFEAAGEAFMKLVDTGSKQLT